MPEGADTNMPNADHRPQFTAHSKPAFFFIFILLLFSWLGPVPFAVTEGWAKDVTLEWDANTEPDLGGYIVYYGTESGSYEYSLDVGDFTSAVISGLDEDTDYYFAVSAYNLDGLSSSLSNEVSTALASYGSGGGSSGGCFIDSVDQGRRIARDATVWKEIKTWFGKIGESALEFCGL